MTSRPTIARRSHTYERSDRHSDHLSGHHSRPLPHQHVAARRTRQADRARDRHRHRHHLAAEISRRVLGAHCRMSGPTSIEGYAIISADGMLADAQRRIPPQMIVKADQAFFHGALDGAALVVHGRHSHEGGPRAGGRRRLVVTTRIAALAPDPNRPQSLLWNPKGASLAQAWTQSGAA